MDLDEKLIIIGSWLWYVVNDNLLLLAECREISLASLRRSGVDELTDPIGRPSCCTYALGRTIPSFLGKEYYVGQPSIYKVNLIGARTAGSS